MPTPIENNTTKLQTLKEKANSLPDKTPPAKLQEKTVTPSTLVQEIVPDNGYDGLSKVTLNALKLQDITIIPRQTTITYLATGGYDYLRAVTVEGDDDLTPDYILKGIEIFGVTGTLPEFNDTFYITKVTFTYLGSSTGTWEYNCEVNINRRNVVSFAWSPDSSKTQKEISTQGFELCLSRDEIGIYGDIPVYTFSFSDNYSTLNIFSTTG